MIFDSIHNDFINGKGESQWLERDKRFTEKFRGISKDTAYSAFKIRIIRRHTTANELAQEFGVSIRTIQYDIQALTPVYPIYTKQGENGGIFIREDYKPYANSLTPMEVAALHELYDWTEGIHKKVLFQVLRKYGPDKLQL